MTDAPTLYVTQEFAPWFVEGGLGLTSRGLPERLQREHGIEHEVVLPYYTQHVAQHGLRTERIAELGAVDDGGEPWEAYALHDPTTPLRVTLLRCDAWYDRPGLYRDGQYRDFPDQVERALAFGAAVAKYVATSGRRYRLVHANDWQSGAAAARLAATGLPVLCNIHSGWYRGVLPGGSELADSGHASLLEVGLDAALAAVTCSPGYAAELRAQPDAVGALCRAREIAGIVSGVDTVVWDSAATGRPHTPFGPDDVERGKAAARRRLAETLGRPALAEQPLAGVCGRFVPEKGADLLVGAVRTLLEREAASVLLLGGAEQPFANELRALAAAHPERMVYVDHFEQELAWLCYAASDVTLMPSRVEPCGLNQTIALRYGTLPVVAPTGGLRDTVVDRGSGAGDWTGSWIRELTVEGVVGAVLELLAVIRDAPEEAEAARVRGMRHDWTWERTAAEFAGLYRSIEMRHAAMLAARDRPMSDAKERTE